MTSVITRFAPSPTGYLHVGGARTALFSWLLARHFGGKYYLRIEDTDLARSTQQACDQLLEDLRWLGLHWDNPQLMFQSRRKEKYDAIIGKLIAEGKAYEAWESDHELTAARLAAEKAKKSFIYRRRPYTSDELSRFKAENRTPVVRLAMPVKDYSFEDAVLGPGQGVAAAEVQDFVIRKSDGMPTYHFAVVVDDAEMGVTHVLRGQEHLLNTVNHIALQEALGYSRPVYAHLPVILNSADQSKMGKRDRDKKIKEAAGNWVRNRKNGYAAFAAATGLDAERLKGWISDKSKQLDFSDQAKVMQTVGLRDSDLPEIFVHDFRKNGYFPEILLNFLALLGWNPGNNLEHMSMDQMVQLFTLDRVGQANASFDRAKLLAFNTQQANTAPMERQISAFRSYLEVHPESPLRAAINDQLSAVLQMKKGYRTLREVDEPSRFLFLTDEEIQYDPAAVEKVLKKNDNAGLQALRDLQPILSALLPDQWKHDALETAVKQYCDAKGIQLGAAAQPLRVAVSGSTISPPIFHSVEFLGREKTLGRMGRALEL